MTLLFFFDKLVGEVSSLTSFNVENIWYNLLLLMIVGKISKSYIILENYVNPNNGESTAYLRNILSACF